MRHIPVKNLIKCKVQQNEEGLNDLLADAFFLFFYSVFLSGVFWVNRRELWDSDLEGWAWDVFVSPFHSQNVVSSLL